MRDKIEPKGEFDLIKKYFNQQARDHDDGVYLGIGDDCAILDIPDGHQLAVTTDTLVENVHFFPDVDPYTLGYKSLAVNLSDLAAMGAMPKWASLAITLPTVDETWLAEFTRGLFELANKHQVKLVGGDTTKGPLSITISAKGIVKRGMALQRNGAKLDDLIVVSGTIGDGAIGLACKLNQLQLTEPIHFYQVLTKTEPRNALGMALLGLASSCIDISDGLLQDLSHILNASHCSACIYVEKLPLSSAHKKAMKLGEIDELKSLGIALNGGDDYELLFTISADKFEQLRKTENDFQLSVIGTIIAKQNQQVILKKENTTLIIEDSGWDHFKD